MASSGRILYARNVIPACQVRYGGLWMGGDRKQCCMPPGGETPIACLPGVMNSFSRMVIAVISMEYRLDKKRLLLYITEQAGGVPRQLEENYGWVWNRQAPQIKSLIDGSSPCYPACFWVERLPIVKQAG